MKARSQILVLAMALTQGVSLAADPPATMNYQGVLRDAADKPRTGTFDMTFRFFDAGTSGNEILVDSHTAGGGSAVAVANGLFNVQLGTGTVSDGSGAGFYLSIGDVFRAYADVWMEIAIGAETLSPRVKIHASAYALNAGSLQGKPASSFLDTSSASQSKSGPLSVTSTSDAVTGVNPSYGSSGVLGAGNGVGVQGYGNIGGLFLAPSGSIAELAAFGEGVYANGLVTGGTFLNSNGSGQATLATGETGINAYGTYPGRAGHFEDRAYTGRADLAIGDTGILARGAYNAGEFTSSGGYVALLGSDYWGAAGYFEEQSSYTWTYLDSSGYGLLTNGPKDFVQNHPTDPTRLVAYTALEGPEAGTYTRGSGTIRGGEARIALDPTFALTTDPDVGLTAVVTPRGPRILYVASVSTKELVVRSAAAAADEVAFDYVVNGLRLGFENQPVILASDALPSATVPSVEAAQARLAAMPEDARRSTPLARLSAERARSGAEASDLAGARALIAGINSPEHALHARSAEAGQHHPVMQTKGASSPVAGAASRSTPAGASDQAPGAASGRSSDPGTPSMGNGTATAGEVPHSFLMPIEIEVQPGDVLANDPALPGSLRLAEAEDPGVIGVVAGPAGSRFLGQAPIALAGTVVPCSADASSRPIAVNDLLVASPTPGFAMSAGADPRQGTVIGKALEPLPAGTGTIRILVMSR